MRINKLHKNLTHRYLLWAYKTTRESFERIERKTTQLKVDQRILKTLSQSNKFKRKMRKDDQKFIEEFKQYITAKVKDEISQKYSSSQKDAFHPQYLYLKNRLFAIEEAIEYFLGFRELKRIENLFEEEFTTRILQARDH
jgi:hypothetical protein